MPVRALLIGMPDAQDRLLAERFAQKLQADWQAWLSPGKAARHHQPADARQVAGDGENIHKVHLQRVLGLRADLEGGSGRGRANDGIHLLERLQEVVADQGADLLGAEVIGVVVAAAKDIGAQDNAPLHFRAEALPARLAAAPARPRPLDALAVTNAIKPR